MMVMAGQSFFGLCKIEQILRYCNPSSFNTCGASTYGPCRFCAACLGGIVDGGLRPCIYVWWDSHIFRQTRPVRLATFRQIFRGEYVIPIGGSITNRLQ